MEKHIDKQRLIGRFCELARIPSPSGQEEAIAQLLAGKLAGLGLTVQRDAYGNLVAKLPGTGTPIILCCHMDTVAVSKDAIEVVVDEESGTIKSDGTTILGADNKDSIAAILEMLEIVREHNLAHVPVELVFTRQEEDISQGIRNFDFSLVSGNECIISDQAEQYGTVTMTAPFLYAFNVEIRGVKCHVKEPEKGVNAVHIMARTIGHPDFPVGRIDHLTTANIGSIVGGLRAVVDDPKKLTGDLASEGRNSIPDLVRIYGEVRGADEDVVRAVLGKIEKKFMLAAEALGGAVVFCTEKKARGYIHKQDDPLVVRVADVFQDQQVEVRHFNSIGGADANLLEARGIHTVVFSSAHTNNHRNDETLNIADLVRLADFFLRFVTKVTE